MNKPLSDKKIFNQIKKKNHKAFIEAYDLYIDDIYRFTYFKVGSVQEAEDIVSTVFLKAWNHVKDDDMKRVKTFRAFLYKITRNSIIDYYRARKDEARIDDENTFTEIADESQDIINKIEINSDFEIIKYSLLKLKSEYREIIIMRFVDQLSFSEISKVLDKSKGSLRVLAHRAMEALKQVVGEDKKL